MTQATPACRGVLFPKLISAYQNFSNINHKICNHKTHKTTVYLSKFFQKAQEDAGNMGLCTIVFGMLGSIIAGVILDKSHKFK